MSPLKKQNLLLKMHLVLLLNFKKKTAPFCVKIIVEKQTIVKVSGFDKQQVGMVVSKIKTFRKIEPYKGKGIREKGQHVLKKEGKKK